MSVRIENIQIAKELISADVFVNEEKNKVWYEFPFDVENICDNAANALLVAFIPIAMKVGNSISIDGEISNKLYNQLNHQYQDIMKKWYPELNRVEIICKKIYNDKETNNKRKNIACFTGGVDAFYTLIKNNERIDDLLYVWGFDIPLTEEKFYNKVKKHLSTVAKNFEKNIIFVKTNLGYEITNKYASWGDYCYGPAIASVILLMNNNYKICYMPSCNDYSVLVPRGSHILINHLWNSNGIDFIYDGAEFSRTEKVD